MKFELKKSLGQHFLRAPAYVRAIADAAAVGVGDTVLEIGPGDGALTAELLSRGARVIALEKDTRLIPILSEKFSQHIETGAFTVIETDALEADPAALPITSGNFKLVANIPYYITGALFRKFLSGAVQPSILVFLIQKEVAERIARSKKESILSLALKVYGQVAYVKTVPRGAFSPAPDVDSAILAISGISRANFVDAAHENRYFELLHAGFAQKRKLLKRNIEPVYSKNALLYMQEASIPEQARAEDVPLEQWLLLANH